MIFIGTLAMIFVCNLHEMPTHVEVLRPQPPGFACDFGRAAAYAGGYLIERHRRIEIDVSTEPRPVRFFPSASYRELDRVHVCLEA